jgi:hypothetical protein
VSGEMMAQAWLIVIPLPHELLPVVTAQVA